MKGVIEVTKYEAGRYGDDFYIVASEIASIHPSRYGNTSTIIMKNGERYSVLQSSSNIVELMQEAAEEENAK